MFAWNKHGKRPLYYLPEREREREDRGTFAIKERLPSAGVNIYRYISASFVNLDQ